jgi:hypothetical protein
MSCVGEELYLPVSRAVPAAFFRGRGSRPTATDARAETTLSATTSFPYLRFRACIRHLIVTLVQAYGPSGRHPRLAHDDGFRRTVLLIEASPVTSCRLQAAYVRLPETVARLAMGRTAHVTSTCIVLKGTNQPHPRASTPAAAIRQQQINTYVCSIPTQQA